MKIKNPFKGLFSTKSHTIPLTGATPLEFFPLLGSNFTFGNNSRDFLRIAYGLNPYVFMVIDRIAQKTVILDRLLVKRSNNEEIITNDNLDDILSRPNNKEDGGEFLYRAYATFLAAGECFVIKVPTLEEETEYVIPINYNVVINENRRGDVISYTVTMFGITHSFLPFEVLHIKKPDITVDEQHGFSTLRAGRKVYESNNEVWASEASLHKNKGVAGVLFGKGARILDPKEKKELQDQYDTESTGINNFGKVKVSSSELGYKQMGMNPTDLKSIETRIEHLRTICAMYNVDSKLFGDPGATTFNNVKEASKSMLLNAVLPLANKVNPKLVSFIGFDFNEFDITWKVDKTTILELTQPNIELSTKIIGEVTAGILTTEQGTTILYPELAAEQAMLTPSTTATTDDSLEGNAAAENQNAQAQANLRGSVGGVQGVLSIQASVVAGTTSRDSALTMLVEIYGFDQATANGILGSV